MGMPEPLHRPIPTAPTKSYEVLAEMTEMWWQAVEAAGELCKVPSESWDSDYLSALATATGKYQAWEQAIGVYAGWNGTELERYLSSVKDDKMAVAR